MSVVRWESVRTGHVGRGRDGPEPEHDLLVGNEHDRCRVPRECSSVHVGTKGIPMAIDQPAELARSQSDSPLGDELTQGEGEIGWGLDVDDPRGVVGMEHRDPDLVTVISDEADPRGDAHGMTIDPDVQVGLVVNDGLFPAEHPQSGSKDERLGISRHWPRG